MMLKIRRICQNKTGCYSKLERNENIKNERVKNALLHAF